MAPPGLLGGRRLSKPVFSRVYRVKKHYRLVYAQVGHPLDQAENLSTSLTAITHAFIALALLYLVCWVHRDVSVGNIILVKVGDEVQGKLSDLEYAKTFGTSSAGGDPKTGTPFFMPVEIHRSEAFYRPPTVLLDFSLVGKPPTKGPLLRSPTPSSTPQFRFQHDLESL
ncbi:hypothetical protein P691DRAFT_671771, partial [Macrolepiota fuliginosa MF-IS2]